MFYFDETKALYPRKGILEDAITRSSIDENSYSPIINEVWEELQKKQEDPAFILFPTENYPSGASYKDFSLDKLVEKYSRSASSENDEPTLVEMISLDNKEVLQSIIDYNKSIIYGWFYKNKDGAQSKSIARRAQLESYVTMKDNSDSDLRVSASEFIEDNAEEEMEEKDKMFLVSRLTYYLKLVQECSIAQGMNVLQIIFSESRNGRNASHIVAEGIAKIGFDGSVIDVYGSNHNTSKVWNDFWKWYTSDTVDMWHQIIKEFKSICKSLGINLAKEDYKNFPPKVVNNLLSLYLASNEEYVDTIGRCDKTVISMLEPDKLLSLRSNVPGFDQDWVYSGNDFSFIRAYIVKLEDVSIKADMEEWKWEKGNTNDIDSQIFLVDRKDKVLEFFNVFARLIGLKQTGKELLRSYYYNDYNILCAKGDVEDMPVSISRGTLCGNLGFRDAPDKICFTMNGLIISKVVGQDTTFRYCMVEDVLQLMRTGVNNEWPTGKIICI